MNRVKTQAKDFGIEQYKYKLFFRQRATANVHREKPVGIPRRHRGFGFGFFDMRKMDVSLSWNSKRE